MDIYYLECDGGKVHPLYFDKLDKLLRENGSNIQYNMKRAPKELANRIETTTHHPKTKHLYNVLEATLGYISKNNAMIFFSKRNSVLFNLCTELNSDAQWGAHTKYQDIGFSVTYPAEDNPNLLYIQIHETLHLFGVDDCYDVNKNGDIISKHDCDNPKCIMRYETPSLEICGMVKRQLKK